MTIVPLAADRDDVDVPIVLRPARTMGDRVFRMVFRLGAVVATATLAAVAFYLINKSWWAIKTQGTRLVTSTKFLPNAAHPQYGLLGELVGSLEIAIISLAIAVPLGVASALLINEFVPHWLRRFLVPALDVLAIIPGVIYGLWGLIFLSPHIVGFASWLNHYFSFIPIFRSPTVPTFTNSIFIVGIVISIMVLPVITAVSREAMSQTPRDACEGALALGGTRWGMITDVILPFSSSGIVGGTLLGFGRAMGETIAVLLLLAANNVTTFRILGSGGGTITDIIGNLFEVSNYQERSALLVGALLLFAVTVVLGIVARSLVIRSMRSRA